MNTLSLVKSDSLFSYTAPLNILGWILHPLRYTLPFRQYVKVNRTVIKITHFPILLVIFLYERTILGSSIFEQSDVFSKKRIRRTVHESLDPMAETGIFSPASRRIRGGSVASHHQDRALDEVFKRPYRGSFSVSQTNKLDIPNAGGGAAGGVVASWMRGVVSPTGSPPTEFEDRFSIRRRVIGKRTRNMTRIRKRDSYGTIEEMRRPSNLRDPPRSVISDPEEFAVTGELEDLKRFNESQLKTEVQEIIRTDDDGDDEGYSHEGEEEEEETNDNETLDPGEPESEQQFDSEMEDAQMIPSPTKGIPDSPDTLTSTKPPQSAPIKQFTSRHHIRTNSTQTIRHGFNPPIEQSSGDEIVFPPRLSRRSSERTGEQTPENASGKRSSPRSSRPQTATRPPRAFAAPRKHFQSFPTMEVPHLPVQNEKAGPPSASPILGLAQIHDEPFPSSFATQMAMATGTRDGLADLMLGRIVLSRIGNLEESMKDVKLILHEVKKLGKDKARSIDGEEGKVRSSRRGRSDGAASR